MTNGGLWCSPVAKTSRPTSSALSAIVTIALIRSASVGVRPVVGSVVTSLTVKIPNCIVLRCWLRVQLLSASTLPYRAICLPRGDRLPPSRRGSVRGVAESVRGAGLRRRGHGLVPNRDLAPLDLWQCPPPYHFP